MRVLVTERGERPRLMTKARVITPQAAKHLADRLAEQTFADQAVIVVDWIGDYHWHGEGQMPDELMFPAVYIVVEKRFPEGKLLSVDLALDIESMFGRDDATADDLEEVGRSLADKVRSEQQRKGY